MNKKKILACTICGAALVGILSTVTVFAASNTNKLTDTSNEPTTLDSYYEEDSYEDLYFGEYEDDMTAEQKEAYEKLLALYDQEDAIFEKHEDLWDKVFEAEDKMYDDYDMTAYIQGLECLTDDEKATLIAAEAEVNELYDEIDELYDRVDAIYESYDELWEKVYAAEDEMYGWDDDYSGYDDYSDYDYYYDYNDYSDYNGYDDFDEAQFIQDMDSLTDEEKSLLLADLQEIADLDEQIEALDEIVFGTY